MNLNMKNEKLLFIIKCILDLINIEIQFLFELKLILKII